MRFGLPLSLLLHCGLLAWALLGFANVKPFTPSEPEAVQVATISEDGLTRLMQGDRNAKNVQTAMAPPAPPSQAIKETPRAKPPEPAAPPPPAEPAKPEPPPPPQKAAEPPPQKVAEPPPPAAAPPEKDVIGELALKADAEAKAEAQRKAAAETKAKADAAAKAKADAAAKAKAEAAAKAKADAAAKAKAAAIAKAKADASKKDSLDDLENYIEKPALADKDKNRKPQPSGSQIANASNVKGPQAGAPEGRDTQLTASQGALLGSMIKQAVKPCFNVDGGADGVKEIVVRVAVQLRPDGQLAQPPRIMEQRPGPLYAAVADAAMRAVLRCGPYNFPPELYKGGWDNSVWRFSPGEMF